jgi:hypothetical protein
MNRSLLAVLAAGVGLAAVACGSSQAPPPGRLLLACTAGSEGFTVRATNTTGSVIHVGQLDVVLTRGGQQTGEAEPWIGEYVLPGYSVTLIKPAPPWDVDPLPAGTACTVASHT